jgi:hsp70-interacting protein
MWATGKDEAEIIAEAEARGGDGGGNSPAGDQGQEFESLDSILQWAIGTAWDFRVSAFVE